VDVETSPPPILRSRSSTSLALRKISLDYLDHLALRWPMSTAGATGKDTSDFLSRISNTTSENDPRGSNTSVTTDGVQVTTRFRNNAGIAARNKDRAERRIAETSTAGVSDDEELLGPEEDENAVGNQPVDDEEDDEFSALQNLSKADFRKVINFSLKSAAEAAAAATQSVVSNQPTPVSNSKSSTTFNRHAIVFKVADEISGDAIPRQEIPDCIWKLVQAKVPLTLPCITTASIRFIHNNPTSIKTTRSADGVSQSKELMLDMSAFGDPEAITQSEWQDAWINRLEIIKKTSEKDIYKYFKAHKKYISQQEDFTEQFEAYKRFDIYFCRHYSNTRFKMNPQQYSAKILEFKLKFSAAFFSAKSLPVVSSSHVSASQHQSSRYTPYDRSKGPSSGFNSSFPKGTNSSVQTGQCLICGRFGHRGSNCTYSTTKRGARVTTCWKNGRVITISSNAEPCFQWNLRSECKSNHRASDHFCSVCGSKDHTLSSRKCL
jgi:hypothetical protein